jgi:hypothetical protein
MSSSEHGAAARGQWSLIRDDAQLQLDLGPGFAPKDPDLLPPGEDLHPVWLEELRLLNASRAPGLDRPGLVAELATRVRELRRAIVDTPARSRDGVLAQAELICDLAWNEVVAAAARQVVTGIRRLWQPA